MASEPSEYKLSHIVKIPQDIHKLKKKLDKMHNRISKDYKQKQPVS